MKEGKRQNNEAREGGDKKIKITIMPIYIASNLTATSGICYVDIPLNTKKSSVTTMYVQSAGGRQRSVYKGATEEESAQPSSLPPSAACHASSLRSTGNLVIVPFYSKLPYCF